MQFTPLQLKEKLLGALDEDNNVIDAAVVLEVISILEKFPITREALEQTRIGRHVNELRRKTTNKELAKRAKKLVRGWQNLLTDNCNVNGDSVSTPPQHRNVSVLQSAGNESNPSSPIARSPAISKSYGTQARSSLSPGVSGRPVTPNSHSRPTVSKQPKGPHAGTPELNRSKFSPGLPRNSSTPNLRTSVNSPNLQVLQSSRLSPAVSHTYSPKLQNQGKADFTGKPGKLYSPKIRPNTPCQSPQLLGAGRPGTPVGNEDSLSSFPGTPSSVQSGNSQETGNGHAKNKKCKTSPQKGGKEKKSNHSRESLSQSSEIGSRADQSNVSKTDIANRKRTHPADNNSVPPVKQQKLDSVHSLSSKHPLNGKLYQKHLSDKTKHNAVVNNSATLEFSQSSNSPPLEKSLDCSTPSNKKSVTRQDSLKFNSAVKTPKVKTTAELIAELQQKTGSANYGNDILEKLRTKQIEHEADVQCSVLPPGIRPRRKRKSNDSSYISVPSPSLSQTKTELVQKFLQTSLSPTSTDLSSHIDDFSVKTESPINSSQNAEESIINISEDIKPKVVKNESEYMQQYSRKHENSNELVVKTENDSEQQEKRLTIDEIYSQLPPIDIDSIDWESSDYVVPEPHSVQDGDVLRVHSEPWEGVNGCRDGNNVWHDWASTLTLSSYDDDPLHILPYVIVDD
ncbi:hypothetical protein SNE40_018418 [Patella caerulea]|uniref:Mediator of RNA polymerase II transcription subunit 26 n=1 Tax=Patella caerulea TaxID=87958 RepID=A0AAN8J8P3_PATCE